MNLKSFLKDQSGFVLAYLVSAVLIVVVVQLDFLIGGKPLRFSTLIYLLILEFVILALALIVVYYKKRPYYKRLKELSQENNLSNMSGISTMNSAEELLVEEAWTNLYGLFSQKLQLLEAENDKNIYFLSQWAHHMKTPVAVIDLLLQRSREEDDDPNQKDMILASIEEENIKLSHALSMLLNHIRLKDFTSDFRIDQVSPLGLARDIINEHKREFVVRKVYPKIEMNMDLEHLVESDAKWLRFVLEQLITNALKYSSCTDKEGLVVIRMKTTEKGVCCEIEDNGIGIAKEDLNRVFEPFYTGLNGRKYHQSTGMGLYLAKEICEKLNHELEIESKEGEGTIARVNFFASKTIFEGVL